MVVIDLDSPKNDEEVPINILRTYAMKMIESTYCTVTPSGGVHIYLLSRTKPSASQPRSTHKVNIDYQANTGTGRGKYIVADYRWDPRGEHKENYTKIGESPETIAIVENTDDVLNAYLSDLEKAGHIKDKKNSEIDKIIEILKQHVKEGHRQMYSCCIAGYFKKQGYSQEVTENIISDVFAGDPEISHRVQNVELTYQKPDDEIKGWTYLQEYLTKKDQDALSKLTHSNVDRLKLKIQASIRQQQDPRRTLLAAYLEKHLCIFTDPYVHKHYMQDEDGSFKEIDDIDIMLFCNEHFGANRINKDLCYAVFKYFTVPVEKDYDLIEFANGVLNTKTQEFFTNKRQLTKVPKLKTDLNWNPEAPGLEIEKLVNRILVNPKYPEDKDLWLRAVGHAFMGSNRIGKLVIVTGPSGTGKSTLTTLLQRIFETSQIPTSKINDNERFTLYGLVNKDINIDDDIDNGLMKGIGNLNTVITGNGLDIEVKGENRVIHLTNQQIARLFANGNTLPPVLGEGFERRLLLIHANNQIEYDERNDTLQNDILLGDYDKLGMEWLIYTTITKYWEKMDEAITSQAVEEKMKEEHEFKSYPLKVGVSKLFEDDYENGSHLSVSDVNNAVKLWSYHAWKFGKISKEHKKPSTQQIKKAMDQAGFSQTTISEKDEDGHKHRVRVYEDIKKTGLYNFILGELD
jgi:phage/plasmid-associated DNA primase